MWCGFCIVMPEDWKQQLYMVEESMYVGAQYFLLILEVHFWGNV